MIWQAALILCTLYILYYHFHKMPMKRLKDSLLLWMALGYTQQGTIQFLIESRTYSANNGPNWEGLAIFNRKPKTVGLLHTL